MLKLPDVTLVALSSVKIPETIASLKRSYSQVEFPYVKLVTHSLPDNLPEEIIYEECPQLKNIDDYNYYAFIELGRHIQTKFALVVQHDSWILDVNCWTDEFLGYSFIGAPWPIAENSYIANNGTRSRVGNDGFSIKSKRLLDIPKENNFNLREEQGWKNVDGQTCCYWKKELLELGINYAPVELAAKFSFETLVSENIQIKKFFGFHKHYPYWIN
jgi:hypothetical protein